MGAIKYSRDLEVLGLSNKQWIVGQSWLFKTTFISCQWHLTVSRLLLFNVFFPWQRSGKEFLDWNIQDLSLEFYLRGMLDMTIISLEFIPKLLGFCRYGKKNKMKYTSIMLSGKVKAGTFSADYVWLPLSSKLACMPVFHIFGRGIFMALVSYCVDTESGTPDFSLLR